MRHFAHDPSLRDYFATSHAKMKGDGTGVTSSAVYWSERVQAPHRRCGHDSEAHIILISSRSERLGFATLDFTLSFFICI